MQQGFPNYSLQYLFENLFILYTISLDKHLLQNIIFEIHNLQVRLQSSVFIQRIPRISELSASLLKYHA